MKRIVFLIAICSIMIIELKAQNLESMNVMSFNIRYDNPNDGKQNWHKRKKNVVRMLHFYEVDIVGMQEVLFGQLNYLKSNLSEFDYVGVGREDGKTKGEYAPIFYKKERFEVLKRGTFWLSETPEKVSKGWDAALERIATWAIFKDKQYNKEFIFMNTHFDHKGKMARLESSKLLKQKAIELAGELPLILTGDFNLEPHSEGITVILEADNEKTISNTSEIAKYTYGPAWTTCGFDGRPFEQRKIIDYVFVRGINVHRYAVLAEMLNETYLSDHCPVFVELEL